MLNTHDDYNAFNFSIKIFPSTKAAFIATYEYIQSTHYNCVFIAPFAF